MKIETQASDGLVLNWSVPREVLPALPSTLRYQILADEGSERVIVSAVLFHHERLHWPSLPWVRFSWPQMNVRICVLDEEGVPSLLIRRIFVPAWVYPGARLFAGPPVAAAQLDFPRPSNRPDDREWSWRAAGGLRFAVIAKPASPAGGPPLQSPLGSWERTVRYVHDRPRGYTLYPDGLRRMEVDHPPVSVLPVAAEIREADLLAACFGLAHFALPPLHSSWLFPQVRFTFDLALTPRLIVPQGVPHPAASRAALRQTRPETAPRPAA